MDKNKIKIEKRDRRHKRIRSKISGTAKRPRLSVFKSNKYVYAQLVDDEAGKTLVAISTDEGKGTGLVAKAEAAGVALAKEALSKGLKTVVFDRSGYVYTGRVKALADGARKGGLVF